jgi:hypothetical protein
MNYMRRSTAIIALILLSLVYPTAAKHGQPDPTPAPTPPPTAPPAPVLAAPANGASLVQPITLDWNPTSAPGGPIGSYTWQVGTTSAFTTVIASGFTNMDPDTTVPTATEDKVSGLPNGTYFWRVKASQTLGGPIGSVETAWSAARSFTVTGLGAAPGAPVFNTPANNAQFHLVQSFKLSWSAVPGAHYYLLEIDDEPTFSYPLTLTNNPMTFGTQAEGMWGNAIANVYYRVRAVSVDNVRSLPSATLVVHITDAAPLPAAPAQVSPAAGATVQLPFFLDWTDTPNPQVPGYQVEVNPSSTFGNIDASLIVGPTRSEFMITPDLLPPGNYFWRVRASAGNIYGAWSPGRAITVNAAATTPVNLFGIIAEPGNGYGGNSTQARVMLDAPAPAGGAVVTLASDLPQAEVAARTITIPAGKTDAPLIQVTTGPVPPLGIIGVLRAAYGQGWQQSSLGVLPILYGIELSAERGVGGTSLTGTVTLLSAAPPGGITVRLVSSDTSLVRPPATVFIPGGATDADFTIATSPVAVPTRVTIDPGTENDSGVHAFQVGVYLNPPGSAAPAPSLSSLTLSQPSILAGNTVTGTVRLTSAAPAGGAVVVLQGSMEGQVIVPPTVTVPAGSISATFTTSPAPEVNAPHWVFIGARYGTTGGSQARLLRIDPAPGVPTLLAIGPDSQDLIGGNSGRASVGLVIPAPAGGAVVNLTSDNPSIVQVPATVSIADGNSTNSFTFTTSRVSVLSGARINATAGGVTRSIFVNVAPDPNAPPLLQSMTISPASVTGGTSATGTVFLSAPAPSGGIFVTLATSNPSAAQAPGIVNVPGGQSSASYPLTTFAVSANTTVTITAFFDTTRSATITVLRGTPPPTPPPPPTPTPTATPPPPITLPAPSLIAPAADARFAPGTNITFDWSDVTGAASYTIQIDDSNSFPAPLIVGQTVTASQFSTSTLPTTTMWWRVRANNASGNPGTWSAVRRFEVKR